MQFKSILTTALAFAAISVLGVAQARATDFVWDGGAGADNDWTTEANWDLDSGYPNDQDDKATIDPASADTVYLSVQSANITVGELILGEYATLEVELTTANNFLIITAARR